jgi:hypothetical protein
MTQSGPEAPQGHSVPSPLHPAPDMTPFSAGRPAPVLPAPTPEELEGQEVVAVIAGLLPLIIALYTIVKASDRLGRETTLMIGVASAGAYALVLTVVGLLLARRPTRLPAGRSLIAVGSCLTPFLAATGWMAPRNNMTILVGMAATAMCALAAASYARVWGRSWRTVLPLVVAVLLLGLSARVSDLFPGFTRAYSAVIDVAAAFLACGVFLRPDRAIEAPGRIAMALAVPVAMLATIVFWSGAVFLPYVVAIAVTVVWATRALRPYFHDGATTVLSSVLLAVPLWLAVDTVYARQLALVVGLVAMLQTAAEVEHDSNAGLVDQKSPLWFASALWILLAGTWAHDLRLIENLTGLPTGFGPGSLAWVALFALPMALPPFLLARVRRRNLPPEADLEDLAPGLVSEITGWSVLALVTGLALQPASRSSWPLVSLVAAGAAALVAAIWVRASSSPMRRIAAQLLLLCPIWLVAQGSGGPTALAASWAALALSLWPLVSKRNSKEAGAVGLVLFPLLTAEALFRGAPVHFATASLAVFGLIQLLRPPLADLPWVRLAGPIALVSAAWIERSQYFSDAIERAPQMPALPLLLSGDPAVIVGALGALMALPLFFLAQRRRRKAAWTPPAHDPENLPPIDLLVPTDPGMALEAIAWTSLGISATVAIVAAPTVGWGSVATLAGGWVVVAGSARSYRTPLRRAGAHVLLISTLWAFGLVSRSPLAALTASAATCLFALAPLLFPVRGREGGWVGLVLFPFAVAEALVHGAAPLPGAALLGIFGLVHLIRPPLSDFPWTRAAGLPAVLVALGLVLFGDSFTPSLLPATLFTSAAGLALAPFALWAAVTGGPLVLVLEVLAASAVVLMIDCQPAALLPLAVLALGRNAVGFAAGAPALLLGAAMVVTYGPTGGLDVAAGGFAIAGGTLLLRALPIDVQRLQTVGPLGLVLAPLLVLFVPRAGGVPLLSIEHLPLAMAVCLLPFAGWVQARKGPTFLAWQATVVGALVGVLAIVAAFLLPSRSLVAIAATAAALLALGASVLASRGLEPELAPIAWGIAALAAPIALVPLSSDPWQWPVATFGAVEVLALGEVARRRLSPTLAGWTIVLAFMVSAWIGIALSHRVLADATYGLLAVAGGAVAVMATLVLVGGRLWLGAPHFFLRPFIHVSLVIAALVAAATIVFSPVTRLPDVLPPLFALAAVAVLSARLAWQDRAGWPLFLAGGALLIAYVHLRVRTDLANPLQHWEALVAVGAGLGLALIEISLRRSHGVPEPAAAPMAPDEIPFAIPALRLMTAFLMALSAVAFFGLRGPVDAIGPALATGFFLRRARPDAPLYPLLASLYFSATVVALLANAGVVSPAAYVLPICAAAAQFMRRYRDHLGHEESALRAVPAVVATLTCVYEAFNSSGLRPDLVLLGLGLVLALLSRRWGQVSHLALGIGSVVLAGIDVVRDRPIGPVLAAAGTSFLPVPMISIAAAAAGAVVIRFAARLFIDPAEFRPPLVRGFLALATVTLGLTLAVGPAASSLDVALAMLALAAVASLALYFARFERRGWPLLIFGAAPVAAYVFLRARTDWLNQLHRWDALVAVGAGLVLIGIERLFRRKVVGLLDVDLAAPDDLPFGLPEIRLGTAVVMGLSAVAFFDLHGPIDAIGPVLGSLFFLRRARRDTPIYGVVAALFLYTTLVLFLIERHVDNPIFFALPLGASVTVLMHVYRDSLGYEGNALRAVPPLATAAVCGFQAMNSTAIFVPTFTLLGLGMTLLLLARLWHLRSHVPIGLGCLAAALLTMITDWNAHGWTVAALGLGLATLLVPAVLLRWR